MKQLLLYLGNFGIYQAFLYVLCAVPGITGGAQTLAFSWTGYAPFTRCFVPGFDTNETEYDSIFENKSRKWFVEPKSKGHYCHYCQNATENPCLEENARICDMGFLFDPNTALIPNSLSIQFEMVCQNVWMRQLLWSLNTVGMFIGAALSGYMADKFGRRKVMLFCGFTVILLVNGAPFAENYYVFAALQLLIGAVHYGCYLTAFIVLMELVDGLPRTFCGIWYQGYFTLGILWNGMVAYFVRDWRWIQFAAGAISFLYILFYWTFPESIRWLAVNGHEQRAKEQVVKIAKVNRINIPEKVLDEEILKLSRKESITTTQVTAIDLFKDWPLARTTLIVFFTWLAVSMSYYGLAQNTSDLPGDAYTTYILSALFELPGLAISVPMMEYMGRRWTLVALMGVGGASCVLAGFIRQATTVLILALLGKLCISGAFAVIYNYSAEIFPTVVRQSGTGLSSVCARIGSLSAPQIRLLGEYVADWLPIAIYGVFALIAAFLDCFLPETKDKELPETIQDGQDFCRGKERQNQKSTAWTTSQQESEM